MGPVLDNQALLVASFPRAAAQTDLPIIFDGHVVIDGKNGLVEIPTSIFRALGLEAIFLLCAAPADILAHRSGDAWRSRPQRTEQEIARHQEIAIVVARRIATELDIPFQLIKFGELNRIARLITDAGLLTY